MAVGHKGDVCGYEFSSVGVRDLEGEWDGAFTDDEVRLAGLGDREEAVGARGVCIQVIYSIFQSKYLDRQSSSVPAPDLFPKRRDRM